MKVRKSFINIVVTYPSKKETTQNMVKHKSAQRRKIPISFLFFFFSENTTAYVENKTNAGMNKMLDTKDASGTKSPFMA